MKKLSFDTALKRLEEIVDLLEAGQLSLEESLRMFEEGVKISLLLPGRTAKNGWQG